MERKRSKNSELAWKRNGIQGRLSMLRNQLCELSLMTNDRILSNSDQTRIRIARNYLDNILHYWDKHYVKNYKEPD